LLAIGLFSIGEMVASPTKLRYMNEIAPKGKEGLFLGFANATTGIGWIIGSLVAGSLYENGGDKVNLSLQELSENRSRTEIAQLLSENEIVDAIQGLDDSTEIDVLAALYAPENAEVAVTEARQQALEMLQTDPEETEALAKLTDPKAYPRRLSSNLGIPAFDANLMLLLPGLPEEVDLPALQERLAPLWAVVAPTRVDLSEREKSDLEPLEGLLFEHKDGVDPAAVTLWLINAENLPATAEEFAAVLEEQKHVPPAGLEALRQRLLEEAATKDQEGGEEAGDKFITSAFQRSRVFEMAAAEEGMSEMEFKQHLWDKYEPYSMWAIFALIGVGSGVLLLIYDYGVRRYDAKLS